MCGVAQRVNGVERPRPRRPPVRYDLWWQFTAVEREYLYGLLLAESLKGDEGARDLAWEIEDYERAEDALWRPRNWEESTDSSSNTVTR